MILVSLVGVVSFVLGMAVGSFFWDWYDSKQYEGNGKGFGGKGQPYGT